MKSMKNPVILILLVAIMAAGAEAYNYILIPDSNVFMDLVREYTDSDNLTSDYGNFSYVCLNWTSCRNTWGDNTTTEMQAAINGSDITLTSLDMTGDVDMNNNDINNVGTLDAGTIIEGGNAVLTDATVFVGDVTGTSGAMTVVNTQGLSYLNITDSPWLTAETNATTECGDGNYLDGNGNCIPFNTTVDQITASTTYDAVNISTLSGTLTGGNLTSIQFPEDGDSYNVTEAAGANPLIISINFSGVSTFDSVVGRIYYSGGQGHEMQLEIWRNDTSVWENYIEFTDMTDFVNFYVPVFDPENHVDSDGNVSLRFNHAQNGNPSHTFKIDYIIIVEGWTALSVGKDHDGLGGRDSTTNHPWALDKAGTRALTANWPAGSFNITAEEFLAESWSNVSFGDDEKLYFGDGSDVFIQFNSTANAGQLG